MGFLSDLALSKYIKKLLPTFSRNVITKQIDLYKDELLTKTLPPYLTAMQRENGLRGRQPFKSAYCKIIDKKIMSDKRINLKNKRFQFTPANAIEVIYNVLNQTASKLDYINKQVNSELATEIVNEALNYRQTTLIRLSDLTDFFLMYSRRLLILMLHHEMKQMDATLSDCPFVKGDLVWMEANFETYLALLGIYSQEDEKLVATINSIPPLEVSNDPEDLKTMQLNDANKVDPLKLGFIPNWMNPIYGVKDILLTWRFNRLESAKAEREQVELQLRLHQTKLNGENNPKLEQIIQSTQERLKKLNLKVSELENDFRERYGLDDE